MEKSGIKEKQKFIGLYEYRGSANMTDISDSDIFCQLIWGIARRHGWSKWVPEDVVVKKVASSDRDRARRILRENVDEVTFLNYKKDGNNPKYRLREGPEEKENLAECLLECGYSKIQIEATVSRFEGFEDD
ncbi:MAG: hypothetical protein SXQ77_02185 [Halobacteria archaeon]|nr:hypothetical protein [Halobacteria archaeon]